MTTQSNRRTQTTVPAPGLDVGMPVAVNPGILYSNKVLMNVFNAANSGKTAEKDPNAPSTTSCAHDRMLWRTFLMEAVLGGTETMRSTGKTLLPMYSGEKQSDWRVRLSQAVLYNYTERTASDLSGRLFKTPPKLPTMEDGLPEATLVQHFEDVDGEGTTATEFMQYWFRRGLELGMYHVLVNTPKAEENRANSERKSPTWSFIHPDNVIFAHQKKLPDGTLIIDHLRVAESSVEMDGFAEVVVRRIRVFSPNKVVVYQEDLSSPGKDTVWKQIDSYETDWDRVPLVTFYSKRVGFMEALPPLQDLAYLNVRHWQSYSDQANILTFVRFPILVTTGTSGSKGSKTVGPRKMFRIPDAKGKLEYVEHTGAAIKSGQEDLEALEAMMSNYGSEYLKSTPGNSSPGTRTMDSAESSSALVGMANSFEDAVHELLVMTYRGYDDFKPATKMPRVEFVVDLSVSQIDSTELSTLDLARRRHDISRKGYLSELSRRDILADTFDATSDFEQMKEELEHERKLGLLKVENPDAIPNIENVAERHQSGKSSRDKPDNGKSTTGEEEGSKDEQI